MNIQQIGINEIKPYEKNAKKHSPKQIKQVAKSISQFGWAQPLVVDTDNVLIIGHCRLEAAKMLELQEVPVLRMEDLTPAQVKALRLADNRLNESPWDMALVIDELRELDPDLIDTTGFSEDLILDDEDKDDVVPETSDDVDIKVGDIFQLGNHTLMCGDATNASHLEALMGELKADMVFTDPPYNVNYKGQGKNTKEGIQNDNMGDTEFDVFLDKVFGNFVTYTKKGAGYYVFHSSSTQGQFQEALNKNDLIVRSTIIWNKPMAALGWGDYRWKHEPCFYAGLKETEIQFYGDRTHASVWDFQKTEEELVQWAKKQKRLEKQGATTVWTMKRDSVNEYVHPTQKPVELITYALSNSSKREDIVLDLFAGSGSTLIACEKAGRVCKTMELDPKYVDVVIRRYLQYTETTEVIKNGKVLEYAET